MSEKSFKDYYSAIEVAALKLNNAPHTHKNVNEKAKREGWIYRKRQGRGGGVEYAFDSLPKAIQAEIILIQSRKEQSRQDKAQDKSELKPHLNERLNPNLTLALSPGINPAFTQLPEGIWKAFEKSTFAQRDKAAFRFNCVNTVHLLLKNGTTLLQALCLVAGHFYIFGFHIYDSFGFLVKKPIDTTF